MYDCQSQWPRGLRRNRLLRMWVRIPPGAWMSVCRECCVLSDRRLCDEPISRPDESYRQWCVVVCDLESLKMRRPWPTGGYCKKKSVYDYPQRSVVQPFDYIFLAFYVHGSVHRESNLKLSNKMWLYSVYYISVGSTTCLGCWHPSSGAGTAVITASGIMVV